MKTCPEAQTKVAGLPCVSGHVGDPIDVYIARCPFWVLEVMTLTSPVNSGSRALGPRPGSSVVLSVPSGDAWERVRSRSEKTLLQKVSPRTLRSRGSRNSSVGLWGHPSFLSQP